MRADHKIPGIEEDEVFFEPYAQRSQRLSGLTRDFSSALNRVTTDKNDIYPEQKLEWVVDGLLREVQIWLAESLDVPALWVPRSHVADALVAGIGDGTVSFDDAADFEILLDARLLCPETVPEEVCHYAQTGELGELLSMLYSMESMDYDARIRLRRFYSYDIAQTARCLEQGVNADEYLSVPLSIRLEFSGFYGNTISGVERAQDTIGLEIMKAAVATCEQS